MSTLRTQLANCGGSDSAAGLLSRRRHPRRHPRRRHPRRRHPRLRRPRRRRSTGASCATPGGSHTTVTHLTHGTSATPGTGRTTARPIVLIPTNRAKTTKTTVVGRAPSPRCALPTTATSTSDRRDGVGGFRATAHRRRRRHWEDDRRRPAGGKQGSGDGKQTVSYRAKRFHHRRFQTTERFHVNRRFHVRATGCQRRQLATGCQKRSKRFFKKYL